MSITARFEIFSDDLGATASFYTLVLGFTMVGDDRHNGYLSICRDQVQIGAAYRRGPHDRASRRPVTGVEIVIEVDDLDAEYARVTAAEWPIEEDLIDRPWGLRDFRILDPNGYYYRITER